MRPLSTPYEKTCECCGDTFKRLDGELLSTYRTRRYCTLPCKKALHKKGMEDKAKKKHDKHCLDDKPCASASCGKLIKYANFDRPSDFMERKACSAKCASALRVRAKQLKKPKKPKEPKIKSVSEWLGRMKKSDRLEQMAVCMGLIR